MDFFRSRQTEFSIEFNRCHMKNFHSNLEQYEINLWDKITTVYSYICFRYINYLISSKITNMYLISY